MFLFEKLIVLSKKVEASEGAAKRARKNEAYLYKEHLEVKLYFSRLAQCLIV